MQAIHRRSVLERNAAASVRRSYSQGSSKAYAFRLPRCNVRHDPGQHCIDPCERDGVASLS
jgi:hypothetical protein